MFNNLIESSSHAREYKRRGSFLLFTTGVYAVLLLLAGVASIYAYDAHLGAQTTELEIVSFVPTFPDEQPPEVVRNTIRSASPSDNQPTRSTRTELIDSPSNPNNVPVDIGTEAPDVPPARPDSVIDRFNADPPTPAFTRVGVSGGTGNTPVVAVADPPPPPPAPTPVIPRVLKISKVLNSQAISLPKPNYPPMARQIRVQGMVAVQVLIDETGKVVSAKAVSGHPLLVIEAQRAALGARFSPTMIGDQAVKVSGVITYNFVMAQ
jgi:TonB family protein